MLWAGAALGALLVAFVLLTSGDERPTPTPPGAFSFAALGDAPYYPWEDLQFRRVRRSMDAHDLAWVLHVGDIFWRPCSDEMYRRQLGWFEASRHPVVYTPGDNEWTDCWEPGSGGFAPLERLERLRELFFPDPQRSLGESPMRLATQSADAAFPEFVENARWAHQGVVLCTVHLVGSRNGRDPFPARTAANDEEATRRTAAATAWLRESFAEAVASGASALVVAFHANPGFEESPDDPYRQAFEPFIAALEDEASAFGKPVLLVHGDDHEYVVDHPLTHRGTGRLLTNVTRLQVPGSPEVGWIRVVVRPGRDTTFEFESHVVPLWKYW
jgi:hypothetical protein